MMQPQLPAGYEIRQLTDEEFSPLLKAKIGLIFDDQLFFDTHEAMSEQEREAVHRLSKNLGEPFALRFGLFFEGNFVGWSFGQQDGPARFYMVNSAVLPEHRRKGLYQALMQLMVTEVAKQGFQVIYSRHSATNSAILIPKLKFGFVISSMEISDRFGLLVHLSYFTNPLRRKAMEFRAGQLRPDAELKKHLRL